MKDILKNFLTGAGCTLEELPALLFQLREDRGISQRQLADTAGVNRSVVSRIEAGQDAQLTTLVKLFHALGYEILVDYCERAEEIQDLLIDEKDRRDERRIEGLCAGKRRFY